MRIDGAAALVTGAASGLGAATATHLARLGARVVGFDRDGESLQRSLAGCASAVAVTGDLASTTDIAEAVSAAAAAGPFRVVVNCAATGLPPQRIVSRKGVVQELEPWRQVVDVNLVAAFDVTRQATGVMAGLDEDGDGNRGVIVHTSSIAGLDGSLGVSAYAASKLALSAMVESTARDLGVWGIRVMAIAPGAFATASYASLPEPVRERREQSFVYPKRPGRPAEFAHLVQHIVENDYLNAQCIRLDAGLRIPE